MDYRENDLPKLLERMRTAHTPIHTSETHTQYLMCSDVLGLHRPWLH